MNHVDRFMGYDRDWQVCNSCPQMKICRFDIGDCGKADDFAPLPSAVDLHIGYWEGTGEPKPVKLPWWKRLKKGARNDRD